MQIIRKRVLKISLGDYESMDTEGFVNVSHTDLGYSDEDWAAAKQETRIEAIGLMQQLVAEQLDLTMADDIADAQVLTGNRKSFVHRIPAPEKD